MSVRKPSHTLNMLPKAGAITEATPFTPHTHGI